MVKTRKIKVKSIENEEIIMTMTITKTIISKIIITIMMWMTIKIGNRKKNKKTLKQNKKWSTKSNSYLLKREKRSESHLLLEAIFYLLLGLFVNTLTADDKYSFLNCDNLTQPIQMQLSQKQKTFSQFFSAFSKSKWNFEHFEKKITLIAYVFRKLKTAKEVVRQMSKKSVSEDPSKSTMLNGPKQCRGLHGSTFAILIDHCEGNWVGKSLA